MTTGKAAVLKGVYDLEIKSYPVPDVEDDGMLIKVEAASICGSDGHIVKMTPTFPSSLGHEFAGKIIKMGNKANDSIYSYGGPLKVGDRIVIYPHITCNTCGSCMRYGPGICGVCDNDFCYGGPTMVRNDKIKFNTITDEYPHFKGGFGEYAYIFPGTYVWKIPEDMPSRIASLLDPTAVAMRAIEMAQTEAGMLGESLNTNTNAAIVGSGPIGVLTALILKIMGVEKVIITDAIKEKLAMAKEIAGVDEAINIAEHGNIKERIDLVMNMTNGGADLVIQCANTASASVEGLQMVRKLGTYIEVGNPGIFGGQELAVDLATLVFSRNARVMGLIANTPATFDKAFHILKRYKKHPFDKLFTHVLHSLEELPVALKKMGNADYMKGVVEFK